MEKRTPEFNEQIGRNISHRRNSFGFTQQDLADYAGCSRVQVTNIEKGNNSGSLHLLWGICNALHCTFNDIIPKQRFAKHKSQMVERVKIVKQKVMVKKISISQKK